MNDEFMEQIEEAVDEGQGLDPGHSLLDLFEKMTFREKIAKIRFGLKQPPETGAYKWAKLEMQRMLSPVAAVVVPIIALLLLVAFAALTPQTQRTYEVQMMEPEEQPDLEEIEEIIEPPPEPPDPVDVEFTDQPITEAPTPAPPTDFAPQPAEFDSVAITRSPVVLRGIYGSRNPGSRGSAIERYGGQGTEGTVLRALRWLKTEQDYDGHWGKTRPAMTALALLAYLAHGDTPASPEFGETVEKAIRYLVECQTANGRFKGRDGHDYTQPIAAYALCETYGMTKVPHVKYAAEKAIKVVIKGQNAHGGFNYNLKGPTETRNDMSYIAWCVQALKAAKMANIEVDGLEACMKKAVDGVKKNYGGRDGYGGFGYTGSSRSGLSGAGALCLQFLGEANAKECQNTIAGLENAVFSWDMDEVGRLSKSPIYYWYYITQAKFQHGGGTWSGWNKQFSPTLVKKQQRIGKDAGGYVDHKGKPQEIGFWDSPGNREHTGGNGRVMDTILCTLMLEVYYRYLPTFKAPDAVAEEVELVEEDDDLDITIQL